LYTTLIAVLQNDEPQIGVIHAPALGENGVCGEGKRLLVHVWFGEQTAGSASFPSRVIERRFCYLPLKLRASTTSERGCD